MSEFNDEEWTTALGAFGSLGDGVIRELAVLYSRGRSVRVTIKINARRNDMQWFCVVIVCDGVDSYRLENPRNTCVEVISTQVSWVREGSLVGFDFGGLGDGCTSIAEVRESPMHVCCSRVSVRLEPYMPYENSASG